MASTGMQRDWQPRAPTGSHPSSETQGEVARQGERKKNVSRFSAARCPSALRHLNDITTLSVSHFKPLVDVGRATCRARLAFAAMLRPMPIL